MTAVIITEFSIEQLRIEMEDEETVLTERLLLVTVGSLPWSNLEVASRVMVLCGRIQRGPEKESIKQDQTLKMGTAVNQNLRVSEIGKGCWQHGSLT